jgi:hypothetical protein
MANPFCSCGGSKTSLINPNAFRVNDRLTSSPIQLEDLSIYVELTTSKKGRTVLVQSKEGGSTPGTSQSRKAITVNFIEGSNVGGLGDKKYLTTKFTELTTSFDNNSTSGENLGITSIDIDFNTSYAPMITINFVDLRGSSIFQKDEYIKDGSNPYSVFFELPYPLYKLKVKGYYGQPVEYCLHMTKFTSRFNSQTGNFEITASFIGYTYAMLSDMLIGVLKAIPYTDLGEQKYKDLKDPNKGGDPTLLTLPELIEKISQINKEAEKILSTDENYVGLSNYTDSLDKLSAVRNNLNSLGQNIDKGNVTQYDYYIVDNTIDKKIVQSDIANYTKSITVAINDYNNSINDSSLNKLELSLFTNLTPKYSPPTKIINFEKSSNEEEKNIYSYATLHQYSTINEVTIYNNKNLFQILDKQLDDTNILITSLKKNVAQTLRNSIQTNLGFQPTVRNIIRTFTTSVEVYLSCLYDVSRTATDLVSGADRKETLSKKFKPVDAFDYTSDSQYYAWPTYMAEGEYGILTEKYLGSNDVGLQYPSNVDELVFIDDLFQAFIDEARKEKEFDSLIRQKGANWYSVNPIDSSLLNDTSPYKRQEPINTRELAVLVMIRAMIFLGISNTNLSDDEIVNFAEKEAEAVLNDISDINLKDGFANEFKEGDQSAVDKFLKVKGIINNTEQNVVSKNGDTYYYDYIGDKGFDNSDTPFKKIFPIRKDFFNASWLTNSGDISKEVNDGNLLLSNYQTAFFNPVTQPSDRGDVDYVDLKIKKPYLRPTETDSYMDDGGTYVKLIDKDTFYSNKNPLVSTPPNPSVTLNLEELKKFNPEPAAAGFNVFGSIYGTQEFTSLKYGVDDLDKDTGLPFRFVFLTDTIGKGTDTYNKSNGFGLVSGATNINSQVAIPSFSFDNSVFQSNNIQTYTYAQTVDGEFQSTPMDNNVQISDTQSFTTATHKSYGLNRRLIKEYLNNNKNITYPYVNFQVAYDLMGRLNSNSTNNTTGYGLVPISLFGSRFYYQQTSPEAKALLFLHTFPWNGLGNINGLDKDTLFNSSGDVGFELSNIFKTRAGIISVPKLWPAFIGGLIWRHESTTDPIKFYDSTASAGIPKSLLPLFSDSDATNAKYIPKQWEYLTGNDNRVNSVMSFSSEISVFEGNYKAIDRVILTLPDQAKNEFKKAFIDFVNGDFKTVMEKCEIYDGNNWETDFDLIMTTSGGALTQIPSNFNGLIQTNTYNINKTILSTKYKNIDNYNRFSPIIDSDGTLTQDFKYNIFLEFRDGSEASKLLMDLITEETFLINTVPYIWNEITDEKNSDLNPEVNIRRNIQVSYGSLKKYFDKFISVLNPTGTSSKADEEKKQIEQDIFGTVDENAIKFMLYKSCKNIYDKWIGGVGNDNIMFQCGARGPIDYEIAKKRGAPEPKLIDSFRFVTRSFRDIGDELAINPLPVADYLKTSPNSSFYDAVTHLLSSNNFDFIALPNFINYNDENALQSVFQPFTNSETLSGCGPSFVCMYLGERSKNLDFGNSSTYPNDGFDVYCDNLATLPIDLTGTRKLGEEPVTFFNVTFGQQNQNIFKDITLDQSEFSETAESLKIMDAISLNGFETNKTFAGQNLYNVYSVRSYKVEVEMLGDAMIQPMMYFQLNNIPMFHGAYMITRVKHSIVPNHMSTKFTGVRIRKPETKIFDLNELYMSLLDTMNVVQTNTTQTNTTQTNNGGKNYIYDYNKDLLANVPTSQNQTIEGSTIKNKQELTNRALQEISNWQNGKLNESQGIQFLQVYEKEVPGLSSTSSANDTQPWSAAFTSYIMLAGDNKFPKSPLHYDYVSAAMKGNNGYEAFSLESSLKIKSEVGDLMCKARSGAYTASHCDVVYKLENNKALIVGGNLSNSVGLTELNLDNGYLVKNVGDYKILVKKTDNKYYKSKNLIGSGVDVSSNNGVVPTGPNADYWSLVAICSLENSTDQGRSDVAQSIYNRLQSNVYNENTLKGLITAKGQYEPVSRAVNEFNNISDRNTAILAYMKSKNATKDIATKEIDKTVNALKNQTLIDSSKQFIASRTDFYSIILKEQKKTTLAKSSIPLAERENQIFGCFVGPASIKYCQTTQTAAPSPKFT